MHNSISDPITTLLVFVIFSVWNEAFSASTASRNDYVKDAQKVFLDVFEPNLEHKIR